VESLLMLSRPRRVLLFPPMANKVISAMTTKAIPTLLRSGRSLAPRTPALHRPVQRPARRQAGLPAATTPVFPQPTAALLTVPAPAAATVSCAEAPASGAVRRSARLAAKPAPANQQPQRVRTRAPTTKPKTQPKSRRPQLPVSASTTSIKSTKSTATRATRCPHIQDPVQPQPQLQLEEVKSQSQAAVAAQVEENKAAVPEQVPTQVPRVPAAPCRFVPADRPAPNSTLKALPILNREQAFARYV
jgi:hypothetical protein